MGTLSLTDPVNGTTADASLITNNNSAIKTVVNGGLDNSNLSGSAGIAYSKLTLTGSIVNADISGSAAIALSKLATLPSSAPYRKTTAATVVNTTTETDLLNGEITVAAGAIGTTGLLRLTAFGDWKQNSGGATDVPRFKLKLGATTLLDTNVTGANIVPNSATRYPFRIEAEIMNLGAANSQWTTLFGDVMTGDTATAGYSGTGFATGEGLTGNVVNSNSGHSLHVEYRGANSSAVDTSGACALVLSVVLPAASANCDISLKGAVVQII